MRLVVMVPEAPASPREFRRAFVLAVRAAAMRAFQANRLSPERLEEIVRALALEEPRQ